MNCNRAPARNLWSLTVLCLLRERPMHPYEMQRLIRQCHKDAYLDLKRGSLYHAIERLLKAGLIAVAETGREGRRPERTIYRLTDMGEREVLDWLRELLAQPVRETSQFMAALSFLTHLSAEDAVDQLQARASRLDLEIVALGAVLQQLIPRIGRAVLVEAEYMRAMRQAELNWVRSAIDDIRAGRLTWGRKNEIKSSSLQPEEPSEQGERPS